MSKKCAVILSNEHLAVIKYDDKEVQIPALSNPNAKFVNVEYRDGCYFIVDKSQPEVKKEIKEELKEEIKEEVKEEKFIAPKKHEFKVSNSFSKQ